MKTRTTRPMLAMLAAFGALALPLAPMTGQAQAQPPGKTDWTKTLTVLPSGAYELGNPGAKDTLVEYFSYTCPHCRDFARDGMPPILQGWVRAGTMKIQYRNWIRDPFDLVAALLARCGGRTAFQANHDAIFASYDQWIDKAAAYSREHPEISDPENYTGEAFAKTAEAIGLTGILAKNGVTPAQQRTCLADKQALATVLNLTASSWDAVRDTPGVRDFPGTPTFLLNGKMVVNVANWAALKPHLPPSPASAR